MEIGTWIDGKPIYKRTFTMNINTSMLSYDVSEFNIDRIIDLTGAIKNDQGMWSVPYANNSASASLWYTYSNNSVNSRTNTADWQGTVDVTIQYTKK